MPDSYSLLFYDNEIFLCTVFAAEKQFKIIFR